MARSPRIRPLAREDGVTVWRVDGARVRDRLDVEFTNGAHDLMAPYVPAGEIWLDRDAPGSQEWRFWALYQLVHRRRMASGASYLEALASAERAERRARRPHLPHPRPRTREAIARLARRSRLGVAAGCTVWLVRGRAVRDLAYVHFTLGGHARRYRFIPEGEIWIDDAAAPRERPAVLHHELVELELMTTRGLSYPAAHARASAAERELRAGDGVQLLSFRANSPMIP